MRQGDALHVEHYHVAWNDAVLTQTDVVEGEEGLHALEEVHV